MAAKTKKIILALGGNIGDVPATFAEAFNILAQNKVKILGKSKIIKTAPLDCPPDTPDFLNMAILCESELEALELLALCQKIEVILGRPALHGYHLSRTIDIDIIAIENEKINLPNLIVPHKEATKRDFVMIPVKDLLNQKLFTKNEFALLCEKI